MVNRQPRESAEDRLQKSISLTGPDRERLRTNIEKLTTTKPAIGALRKVPARRRCLIPATGFFEWQKVADGKQPRQFVRKDFEPFAFAGLWEFARHGGEEILSATIIVGEPNPLIGAIHDRMP